MKQILAHVWSDLRRYYLAAVLFLIYSIAIRYFFHAFCPFLIVTGLPCAGCGLTRALLCILTGQWARAYALNPAAFTWAAWGIYFAVCRYLLGRKSKWTLRLLGVVCVITLAVYCYRMATQFPGNPPMTYYRNNILSQILKIMQE